MSLISGRIHDDAGPSRPRGFDVAATACGLKPNGALDLTLVLSDRDASVAATFTRNRFAAAPVQLDRATIEANSDRMRAVVANAGNANACTGEQGDRDAATMQRATADALGLSTNQALVLSTGVIGVALPMSEILSGIRSVVGQLGKSGDTEAARAIMTTDTVPKHGWTEAACGERSYRLGGMAKGAGMIHPNMATMLAILTTDAQISPSALQQSLSRAVDRSFNCISVDGDTSTNDTVVLLANGASGVSIDSPEAQLSFDAALTALCTNLAKRIVADGEGATHLVEVRVSGLPSDEAARRVAMTIATSPLVKTAFAGGDPNWGRILAAAGRADVPLEPAETTLVIRALGATEPVTLVRNGTPTDYLERDAAAVFAQQQFAVELTIGSGPGAATVWTSDLTAEYVKINADYRT